MRGNNGAGETDRVVRCLILGFEVASRHASKLRARAKLDQAFKLVMRKEEVRGVGIFTFKVLLDQAKLLRLFKMLDFMYLPHSSVNGEGDTEQIQKV